MGGYDAPEVDEAKGIFAVAMASLGKLLISFLCRVVPVAKDIIECPDDPSGPDAESSRSARNAAAASGSTGNPVPQNVTGGYS